MPVLFSLLFLQVVDDSLYCPLLFSDAPESKSADYFRMTELTPVTSSGSPVSPDHSAMSSRTEPVCPRGRRQHHDASKYRSVDSSPRFIKPLPEKPLECGGECSATMSLTRPQVARKTKSRGVHVDSTMLATGRYVEYDAVDNSI